ncbi:MAG TPA: 16S rRNA (cytosine(1402)-N(4))-methyltransferase RsmH, partial [Candidatus Saccharimonadales bacterium]|nr:16S rRNA (cytosine(1402)-N(4))-methyltransferase RsmH [Candidatus Saccharimonadales bacterium]
ADKSMLTIAEENLKGTKAKLVNGNFRDIKRVATENGFTAVDGIVFDLGVSNVHFSDMSRGFSFRNPEADLDMRLNPEAQQVKASDLLNMLRIDQLSEMFGRKLANGIREFRETKKFQKVGDFLSLFPEKRTGKLHPATKEFLALRIAVNSELENLMAALPQAYELLGLGGVLAVVSFHSLEDEIVKDFMRSKGRKNEAIKPTDEEVARNPKSRSAILRFIERK